ncbi:MAG: hypothetical protein M3N54_03425, partial [Acidobacteriota bacterium]|nr:hypothetical protein [Acidobacteriota bacterium]
VVDNARRMISKTIDVSVTSVLQTTAGKMIFGKFDERLQSSPGPDRPSPAAAVQTAAAAPPAVGPQAAQRPPAERPAPREQAVGEN